MRKLRLNKLEQFDEERLLSTTDSVLLSLNSFVAIGNEGNPLYTQMQERLTDLEDAGNIKFTCSVVKTDTEDIITYTDSASPHYIHQQVGIEFLKNIKNEYKDSIHVLVFVVLKRKPDSISKTKRNRGIRDLAKVKKELFKLMDVIEEDDFAEQAYFQVLQDTVRDFNVYENTSFDEIEIAIEYQVSRGKLEE